MESRWADLDGPVHYAVEGDSGSPLLLVHGLGGSSANWTAVAGRLAEEHRLYAIDLSGFGRTPVAGRGSSLGANRKLLARFVEEVVGAPVTLVGNSMGGALGILLAAHEPELVTAALLLDPACPRPLGPRSFDPAVLAAFAAFSVPVVGERYLRSRSARLSAEQVVRMTLELCCADASRVPEEAVRAQVAMAEERRGMAWADAAFLSAARSLVGLLARPRRYYGLAARVGCPTLVIQGAEDRLVPVAAVRRLAERRPGWRLEIIPGIGHVPMLEAPERFLELALPFIREVATGRSAV